MNKKALLKTLFLLFTSFFGLGQANTISTDITQGCAPLEVNFTAPTNINSYFWDFKNGATSTNKNPSVLFVNPGNYSVTIKESPEGAVIDTIAITIYATPELSLVKENTKGCPTFHATIVSNSIIDPALEVDHYTWGFGDGFAKNTSTDSVEHDYKIGSGGGKYDVTLTLGTSFPSCNIPKIFPNHIEVVQAPFVNFSTTPDNLVQCEDTMIIDLVNQSTGIYPLYYKWSDGRGDTLFSKNVSKLTYTVAGQYPINLSASYDFGCEKNLTKTVSVGKPTVEIKTSQDSICVDTTVRFNTSLSGKYAWTMNDSVYKTDQKTFEYRFMNSGDYTFVLNYTTPNGQCTSTDTAVIYVDDLSVSVKATPDYLCKDSIVTFEASVNQTDVFAYWTTQNSLDSNLIYFEHFDPDDKRYYAYNTLTPYESYLYVENKLGCSVRDTAILILDKPNARISPINVTKGCVPLEVVFEEQSQSKNATIDQWIWNFGDGTTMIDSTGNNFTHTYTKTGIYEAFITIHNTNNCVDTSFAIEIQVGDSSSITPSFTIQPEEVCWNEEVTFRNTTASTLDYSFRYFIDSPSYEDIGFDDCGMNQTTSHTFDHLRGNKTIGMEIDYNGCFSNSKTNQTIKIKGAETKIDYLSTCDDSYHYAFDGKESKNATSFSWSINDSIIDQEAFTFDFDSSEKVMVALSTNNSEGCLAHADSTYIFPTKIKSVITLQDTNLCLSVNYTFDASQSIDADSSTDNFGTYTWIFDDTQKRPYSTKEVRPKFRFNNSGKHVVTLIAQDINGCTDIDSMEFEVFGIKTDFSISDTTFCFPSEIDFTDYTTGDTTLTEWILDFDDGEVLTSKTSFNTLTHTYSGEPTSDSLYASLTVFDTLGCSDVFTYKLRIYEPESEIILSKVNACSGDSISFIGRNFRSRGDSLLFSWDFGNTTFSTEQSHKIAYDTAGTYPVTLAYQEDSTGCPGDTLTRTIRVQDYPVAGYTIDIEEDAYYCNPQPINFTDNSTGLVHSRNWLFTDSTSVQAVYPTHNKSFSKNKHNIKYVVSTSYGCRDTVSWSFDVVGPEGDFDISKTQGICQSEPLTFNLKDTTDITSYSWFFGDGSILKNTSPAIHHYDYYPPSGTFPVDLVLTGKSDKKCVLAIQKEVRLIHLVSDFSVNYGDTAQCWQLGDIPLQDSTINADTYFWDFGNDSSSIAQGNQVVTYHEAGNYDIMLVVSNIKTGCIDTTIKQVYLHPTPAITAIGDTACIGDTTHLYIANPEPTSSYIWRPFQDLIAPLSSHTTSYTEETTDYLVYVTDTNNCTQSTTATAFIIDQSTMIDFDTSIVIGDSAKLPVYDSSFRNFLWTPETDISCTTCNYPIVSPIESLVYNLNITDNYNCFDQNIVFDIHVKPETFVRMPTSFSPNNDGVNDIVYVKGWGIKELVFFEIYNRWGELIYESSDLDEGWDGRYKGEIQNSDAYAYKIAVKNWRGEILETEGFLNLIH